MIQGRLLELKQQLPSFYEACLEVERDMYLQLRTTSDRAALIERELESAREELKRIQERERSSTEQMIRLQAELAALQHQRDGISELQGPMMQRLQELEREQPLLQEQLARKREECEHLQLELQNTRAQMTEVCAFSMVALMCSYCFTHAPPTHPAWQTAARGQGTGAGVRAKRSEQADGGQDWRIQDEHRVAAVPPHRQGRGAQPHHQ